MGSKRKKRFLGLIQITAILVLVVCLQGCIVATISAVGYGETSSKYNKLYNIYKLEKEMTNAANEKAGMPTEPIKEFKVWLKDQPLNNREIRLFKDFGVISVDDAKEMKGKRERKI